jgi:hypothetical protein
MADSVLQCAYLHHAGGLVRVGVRDPELFEALLAMQDAGEVASWSHQTGCSVCVFGAPTPLLGIDEVHEVILLWAQSGCLRAG